MAGQGATLVLHTSWFNCSSWIRAKEIAAIRVYGCRTFTSPRISGFRPSIKFLRDVISSGPPPIISRCSAESTQKVLSHCPTIASADIAIEVNGVFKAVDNTTASFSARLTSPSKVNCRQIFTAVDNTMTSFSARLTSSSKSIAVRSSSRLTT
ncbi:hypothetical protein B296_00036714 [Ensete ventricosum]|uniref:Uncharacterized protein n=1 Tax=Ensete ventricosum TaxID=4639 RepID=A0A426XCD3_ENSVE|nr:hypothetical protein B296_00036714 [Ensete ventricosum]